MKKRHRKKRYKKTRRLRRLLAGTIAVAAVFCSMILLAYVLVIKGTPQLTLNGDAEVTIAAGTEFVDDGASATAFGKPADDRVYVTGEIDSNVPGTYVLSYNVDRGKQTFSVTRTVTVVDETAPEIALNGEQTVTVEQIGDYIEEGAVVTDACDGDVTASLTTEREFVGDNTYRVTYTAEDAAGNQAQAERVVKIEKSEDAIYLTFDDGPSTEVTPKILDTLAANDIKATFFILNYDEDKLPLIKRMIEEGHTVAIHGYSHDYSRIYTSTDAFMENIYTLKDKLQTDTGYEAFCIRFPGGSSNSVSKKYCRGIMSELVEQVEDEGLMYMDWNVSSTDAGGNGLPASQLVSSVESGLQKGRTNVVLMHDSSGKTTTPEALKTVIAYGKANGYSFYPITEDTEPVHQGVQN